MPTHTIMIEPNVALASFAGRAAPGRAPRRLLCIEPLTPWSGVADFLTGLADWAECNPDPPIEMRWLGAGPLRPVLAAQPLPPGLTQQFAGPPDPAALAIAFAECHILVVPSLLATCNPHVSDALDAGLRVIGSVRCEAARSRLDAPHAGWLFDPLRPGAVIQVLNRVFPSAAARPARPFAARRGMASMAAE